MSGQKEDNPKEIEGEVLEQALNIETVAELKREKAAKNSAFTKVRRCLLTIIQRKDVDSQEIKDICEELDIALENVMSAMDKLFDRYKIEKGLSRKYDKFLDKIQQKEAEIPLHKWNLNSLIKKKCFNNSSQCSRKIPKSFFL